MEVSYFFDLRDKDSETKVALFGVFAGRVVHLVDVGQLLAIFEAWLEFVQVLLVLLQNLTDLLHDYF